MSQLSLSTKGATLSEGQVLDNFTFKKEWCPETDLEFSSESTRVRYATRSLLFRLSFDGLSHLGEVRFQR